MNRKQAVKAAIKATGQLGLAYSKRVAVTTAVTGVVFVVIALVKPNFYKDIDMK